MLRRDVGGEVADVLLAVRALGRYGYWFLVVQLDRDAHVHLLHAALKLPGAGGNPLPLRAHARLVFLLFGIAIAGRE
jgi:hypothetical protein